jgi:hypothetical protein
MFSYKLSSSAEIGSLMHAVWQPHELSSLEVKKSKNIPNFNSQAPSNASTYRKTF